MIKKLDVLSWKLLEKMMTTNGTIEATSPRKYEGLGRLYNLLDSKMPAHVTNKYGNLDIFKLAEWLGVSPQAVYRYFDKEKIPADKVPRLRELAGEENLSYEELAPFVFK